jgi:hypothetical protein
MVSFFFYMRAAAVYILLWHAVSLLCGAHAAPLPEPLTRRVTHSLPVERWALLFGRLHADYQRGKDKLDWFKYADTDVHT